VKIGCFSYDYTVRLGALTGDGVVDLRRAYAAYLQEACADWQGGQVAAARIPTDLISYLRGGQCAKGAVEQALAHVKGRKGPWLYQPEQVQWQSPLTPKTIICAGPQVQDPSVLQHGEFYLKSPHAIVRPGGTIRVQAAVGSITYEAQIAVIIGKGGRHLTPEQAGETIFGYTAAINLVSRRRLAPGWEGTMWHNRYGDGASFDDSLIVGPLVVTADEFGPPGGQSVELSFNGQAVCSYVLKEVRPTLHQWIAYCSTFITLEPGLLIVLGSPHGALFTYNSSGEPMVLHADLPQPFGGETVICKVTGLGPLEARFAPSEEAKEAVQ
jgi:acylpyruvate hydrolase